MTFSFKVYLFSVKKYAEYKISRSQMIFKIGVLKNFAIFTGKRVCWSLCLGMLQALKPETLLKRDSNADVIL